MFEALGKEVVFLKRLRMGSLVLDPALSPGEYRRLTEEEIIKRKIKNLLYPAGLAAGALCAAAGYVTYRLAAWTAVREQAIREELLNEEL